MRTRRTIPALILILTALGGLAAQARTGSLTVETSVAKAEIYLNSVYRGLSPMTITSLEQGLWQLTVLKDGYRTENRTVSVTGGEEPLVRLELRRLSGTLLVTGAPDGTEIEIGGTVYASTRIDLPVGDYRAVIRAFGYEEKTVDFSIEKDWRTEVDGRLEPAPLSAGDLHAVKPSFNPENPANLGSAEIVYRVTAPGSGRLSIRDLAGETVRSFPQGPWTAWKQTVRWDGRDMNGRPVPDARYSVLLEVEGLDPLETAVTVNRSIRYPFTGTGAGIGSAGPVVSPAAMPRGGALFRCDLGIGSAWFMPGFSALLGLPGGLEAGLRLGVRADGSGEAAVDLAGGLKASRSAGALSGAAYLRYDGTWRQSEPPVQAAPRGLSCGAAGGLSRGGFGVDGKIEITAGDESGSLADPDVTASAGLALRYTGRVLSGGLWGLAGATLSGATLSGDSAGMLRSPAAGLDLQLLVPASNLVLGGELSVIFRHGGTPFTRGGFSLGILF